MSSNAAGTAFTLTRRNGIPPGRNGPPQTQPERHPPKPSGTASPETRRNGCGSEHYAYPPPPRMIVGLSLHVRLLE